ncbi:CRP/FNR family nitrogen fixation transcriptional regulator [Bradyrhizobium japonicum]
MLVRNDIGNRSSNKHHLASFEGKRDLSEFKYCKGTEILGEEIETELVYQVISGAVRTVKLLADGRRQINSFHLPGDVFGFTNGEKHRFSAEAIVATTIRFLNQCSPLDTFENQMGGRTSLLHLVTVSLQHAENHMLLLGRKTAREKVAAFLLEMDERQAHPDVIVLPMGRRDIADYLGLALETVSRAISTFQDEGTLRRIGTSNKRLAIRRRSELAQGELYGARLQLIWNLRLLAHRVISECCGTRARTAHSGHE